MSKYGKAFLIWIASIALAITGLSVYGPHRNGRLPSHPVGAVAPSLPTVPK